MAILWEEYEALPHLWPLLFGSWPQSQRCWENWARACTQLINGPPVAVDGKRMEVGSLRCHTVWCLLSNLPPPMLEKMLLLREKMGLRKPAYYQGDSNLITRGMETKLLPLLRLHSITYNAFRCVILFRLSD